MWFKPVSVTKLLSVKIKFTITALGASDLMFSSPSFILHFSGLITIIFFLDPELNFNFDLTIRGTDTVCIDWTLQVLLSFKWVEQKSS